MNAILTFACIMSCIARLRDFPFGLHQKTGKSPSKGLHGGILPNSIANVKLNLSRVRPHPKPPWFLISEYHIFVHVRMTACNPNINYL